MATETQALTLPDGPPKESYKEAFVDLTGINKVTPDISASVLKNLDRSFTNKALYDDLAELWEIIEHPDTTRRIANKATETVVKPVDVTSNTLLVGFINGVNALAQEAVNKDPSQDFMTVRDRYIRQIIETNNFSKPSFLRNINQLTQPVEAVPVVPTQRPS